VIKRITVQAASNVRSLGLEPDTLARRLLVWEMPTLLGYPLHPQNVPLDSFWERPETLLLSLFRIRQGTPSYCLVGKSHRQSSSITSTMALSVGDALSPESQSPLSRFVLSSPVHCPRPIQTTSCCADVRRLFSTGKASFRRRRLV